MRLRLHVLPRWGAMRVDQVTLPAVMGWVDQMRADAKLAPGSQRHCLGLLSRAFSWAVARGLATGNPVRLIPPGARPQGTPARDVKWIEDDATPRKVMATLPELYALAWYVAFGTGCRMGEVLNIKMGDLDELAAGWIHITGSFGSFLKEDKKGVGLSKFVPAPSDAGEILGPWLDRRRAAGAGPEDLVFPGPDGKMLRATPSPTSGGGAWRTTACGSRIASRGSSTRPRRRRCSRSAGPPSNA